MPIPAVQPVPLKPLPEPLAHSPESMVGTPYYDEELDLAQSEAHSATIRYRGSIRDRLAERIDYRVVGDNPVGYWIVDENQQKALYPDLALARGPTLSRVMATDLTLAIEVVTTTDLRKEYKDTVTLFEHNEYHGIPECLLIYPEPKDSRALRWFRFEPVPGRYREIPLQSNRSDPCDAIAGLTLEIIPCNEWTCGRKRRVDFQGEALREAAVEADARSVAELRAENATLRAEVAEHAKWAVEAENAGLLALLKQAGIKS